MKVGCSRDAIKPGEKIFSQKKQKKKTGGGKKNTIERFGITGLKHETENTWGEKKRRPKPGRKKGTCTAPKKIKGLIANCGAESIGGKSSVA